MNDPEIYLIEPYNAYLPKRKRHWHDIVAEQELYARILAETNRNATLAPNMPDQAMPPIQPIPPAGGGGVPAPEFFNPEDDNGNGEGNGNGEDPLDLEQPKNVAAGIPEFYIEWNSQTLNDGDTAPPPAAGTPRPA